MQLLGRRGWEGNRAKGIGAWICGSTAEGSLCLLCATAWKPQISSPRRLNAVDQPSCKNVKIHEEGDQRLKGFTWTGWKGDSASGAPLQHHVSVILNSSLDLIAGVQATGQSWTKDYLSTRWGNLGASHVSMCGAFTLLWILGHVYGQTP